MNNWSKQVKKVAVTGFMLILTLHGSHASQSPNSTQSLEGGKVGFSVINTAQAGLTPEGALVSGGSWFKLRRLAQNAVIIHHPKGDVMIDTGLGSKIEEQFAANSFVMRQLFGFVDLDPAKDQFSRAGYDATNIKKIIPTHLHWDHASGIVDFPQAQVWVQKAELDEAQAGAAPAHLQSQISNKDIQWHFFDLNNQAHSGYEQSLDVYDDGSIVLVDLKGHSAGQVGIFLTLSSGKKYFFIGDTTWTVKGIEDNAPRSDLIKWLVNINWDNEKTNQEISMLHNLQQKNKELIIVPAHDEILMQSLPVFPDFEY